MEIVRKFNAKNGAVIGTAVGLSGIAAGFIFDKSGFREVVNQSSIEEIVGGFLLATLVGGTIPFATAGYANQKFIIRGVDYLSRKLEEYLF